MNPNNRCRVCLEQGIHKSIFLKRGSSKIASKIVNLAKVHISPGDGLPKKICSNCIEKLDECLRFIDLCKKSDSKLRTILYKSSEEDSQKELEIDFESKSYIIRKDNDSPVSDSNSIGHKPENEEIEVNHETPKPNLRKNKCNKIVINKTDKQQCFTCGKVMSSMFRLKTHLRTHTGERPYSCPHCNKTFTLEQNLKVHMRVHTGEKPLRCSICGESFAQTAGLATHKRKHTGLMPYQCKLCPRRFRTNGHLLYHVRRHTGEKNFECDICGKAFIQRSGLKQHLQTHTGERPHICSICGKRMSRASHIKRHKQQVHQGMFACKQCPEKFIQKSEFEKHQETHIDGKNMRTCALELGAT